MSDFLRLKFLGIPNVDNTVSFVYGNTSSGTQSIDISYVENEDERGYGEFVIDTASVADNYNSFYEFFVNDFDFLQTIFTYDFDDTNYQIDITPVDGDISSLVIGNSQSTFTYSTIDPENLNFDNQIKIEFTSLPSDGDEISFTYYPDYPDLNPTENIIITFTGATPSLTASGESPIGATLSETLDNLGEYFNRWYNGASEWTTEIVEIGGTTSFYISPNNLSRISNVSTTSVSLVIKTDQQPSDTYSSEVLVRSPKFIFSPSSGTAKLVRITLNFSAIPENGDRLFFNILRNGNPLLYIAKWYSDSPLNQNYIQTAEDLGVVVENTLDNFNLYNTSSNSPIVYSKNEGNTKIYIDVIVDPTDTIQYTPILNDVPVGFGYLTINLDGGYDACNFEIYSWYGDVANVPDDPIYSVTKQFISDEQSKLSLDFTKLVTDGFCTDPSNYKNPTDVFSLTTKEAKWTKVVATNQLLGVNRNSITYNFFSLDGWIENTSHTHNLPKVLLSGSKSLSGYNEIKRYYHRDSFKRIHYKTGEHFGYSTVIGNESGYVIPNMEGDVTTTFKYLRSVKIPTLDNSDNYLGDQITIPFDYFTGISTKVKIEFYDECKYPLIDIVFKNRYGVLETLSMGKLSRKNLDTDREDFTRSVVDINGNTNRKIHSKKHIDINGRDQWILNTGFIPDYMNDPIDDMFLSNEIYLIDHTDTSSVIPVLLSDSNFNRLTGLTDGLINYTFKFETSHQKINNMI